MTKSMTGFASVAGEFQDWIWVWDIRAVNARGFDLRLRLPDWIAGLEQAVRGAVGGVAVRGSVNVGLRLNRAAGDTGEVLDEAALDRVMRQMAKIDAAAAQAGHSLGRATAADILALRGVLVSAAPEDDAEPLGKALVADLPGLMAAFDAMRQDEGRNLAAVLNTQLDRIEALAAEAAELAEARKDLVAEKLRGNLARVLDNSEGADPDRVAQELALIAVKTDITEEIDRLGAHVSAARALLADTGAVGRKFDFLTQEFNREANTLCAKAQSGDLTRAGLDLKAVIDQMREQVQNVE